MHNAQLVTLPIGQHTHALLDLQICKVFRNTRTSFNTNIERWKFVAVEEVMEYLGLKHPIIFDVYNLCHNYHSIVLKKNTLSICVIAGLSTLPDNPGDSRFWTISPGLQIRVWNLPDKHHKSAISCRIDFLTI